jgi:hypothetical protein
MATTLEATEFHSIGVDDDSWKHLTCDEAKSLLRIFTVRDTETKALGAVLISTPNGQDLYVTPRMHG